MGVFNFNEVDEVTETTSDPRRRIPRIEAPDRRGTVLGSSLGHLLILLVLLRVDVAGRRALPASTNDPRTDRKVLLLPPSLAPVVPKPLPPPPRPVATPPPPMPQPTPPPRSEKISIGEASDQRLKEILLERDRDIGRRGSKVAQEEAKPEHAAPLSDQRTGPGRGEDGREAGLLVPQGPGLAIPRADDTRAQGPSGGLLEASARSVERAMRERRDSSQLEIAGHQMGPLFFDPEGADFTRWINHFKGEVYRNWIIPEPARMGVRGQVGIEFVVERSGRIVRLTQLSSAGMPALDRAAANALQGSDLLPLPGDYPSPSVTMRVTFVY